MGNVTKLEPLLPAKELHKDLFICDVFDAVPKGDQASMEHPIFSLSKKPDTKARRYKSPDGKAWIEVTPSIKGLPTIFDRDVLIFLISQAMAHINQGIAVPRRMQCNAYDILRATGRSTNGQGYAGLKAAIDRLKGTTIETNITTGDIEQIDGFSLINSYRIVRETREGRMLSLEIELSDWVFNSIRAKQVLTIHRDYFRLRKPLDRALYQLARKHCGRQTSWDISLGNLQTKTGAQSTIREFHRMVKRAVEDNEKHDHFPDYVIRLQEKEKPDDSIRDLKVTFQNRGTMIKDDSSESGPSLRPETLQRAFDAALKATGIRIDKHEMHKEWVEFWVDRGKPLLKSNDAAFIAFAKSRAKRMM